MPHPEAIARKGPGPEMKDETEISRDLAFLCGTIGERPTGSQKNRDACSYVGSVLLGLGYEVGYQEFPIGEWTVQETRLTCGGTDLELAANPYSPPCSVTAPLVMAGSLAELEGAAFEGKILLAHGDLTKEWIMPRNFRFYRHEEHCRIVQLIEDGGAAALITVSPRTDQPVPVIIDGDFPVPSCSVTKTVGEVLAGYAGKPVTLSLATRREPARAANVIARSPAAPGQNRVVLCAHIDTKYYTPGALDNAAGVAVLLHLARTFAKGTPSPVPLEFVFFNGEECYRAPGECAYLDEGRLDPSRVILGINVDGTGLRGHPVGISYYGCSEQVVAAATSALRSRAGIVTADPWPQGDHMIFFMHNVPCMAFSTQAGYPVIDAVIHSRNDTMAVVDTSLLSETVRTIEAIVRDLAIRQERG